MHTTEFIHTLVQAITGLDKNRSNAEIQKMCLDYFQSYIEEYFEINFDTKDVIRIRVMFDLGDMSPMNKFQDQEYKFSQAYTAFINQL